MLINRPNVYPVLQSPEDLTKLDQILREAGSLALIHADDGILVIGIEGLDTLNPAASQS